MGLDRDNKDETTNGHSWNVYEKLFKGPPIKVDLLYSRTGYYQGNFQRNATRTPPKSQFGMKSLAEYSWWLYIYREIYYHGKICSQGLKAGNNLKVLLGTDNITKLPTLTCADEEINLDLAGPLDAFWGTQKYILSCIDQFFKFLSAMIVNNTSSNTVILFLNDYCHLHG